MIRPGGLRARGCARTATRRSAARSSTGATLPRRDLRRRLVEVHGLPGPRASARTRACATTSTATGSPGTRFPGGCQCANGDCHRRRVDCNHFRYGQCNTQVGGTTEVVCRLVICQNPATVPRDELQRDPEGRQQDLHARGRLPRGPRRAAARRGRGVMVALVSVETVLLVLLVRARRGAAAQPRRDPAPARAGRRPAPPRARPLRRPAARSRRPSARPSRRRGRRPPATRSSSRSTAAGTAPTLLAFLTSGCSTCAGFWEALGERRLPAGVQHRDRHPRPRSRAPVEAALAHARRGSGRDVLAGVGRLRGPRVAVLRARRWRRCAARAWRRPGPRWPRSSPTRSRISARPSVPASGERRAEARSTTRFAAAGIGPGHPSLYPDRPDVSALLDRRLRRGGRRRRRERPGRPEASRCSRASPRSGSGAATRPGGSR